MFKRLKTKRFWIKTVALTVLLCILNQIGAQTAFALTSGPTAPEATSFEPVDTTDMVDPLTGDLTYNLPLLEVPGPEGGYPLSLSYHAGIQPNEDASWVGLGFTLNPGAINRSVNGFPDDWLNSRSNRRDYWEGGVKTTSQIGLSVPIGGYISASFGLSFSNDTYDGRGVGFELGANVGIKGGPVSVGIGVGVAADTGDPYVFGSVNVGLKDAHGAGIGGIGLGISTNFKEVNAGIGANIGYGAQSAMGISLSSDGKSSFSAGGISASTENSNSGGISTETSSFSINLILASYSKQKTRYWSDEVATSYVTGSLFSATFFADIIPDAYAYDGYTLQEEGKNIVDFPDPNKQQGGAYPNYDLYQVSAQGLGGIMRPYQFNGQVPQQNHWERINENLRAQSVAYYSNNGYAPAPKFRFENDFSNNYLQDYPDFNALDESIVFYQPPFSSPIYDSADWYGGYSGGGELAGSRNIRYFTSLPDGTVDDVYSDRKFVYPVVNGMNRGAHISQATTATHIAGFSITNSNGVTYHYNLPAYSYDEEVYQQRKDQSAGLMFNRQTRPEGYAYTWYLTGITGPDYVDRGVPGVLDSEDYGYWVSFDYGKWSDKYVWRNPSEGSHTDDDNEFTDLSMGRREVYYLNAIRTRTNTAIFEKDVRADAKGASPEIFNKNWSSQNNASTNYQNEGMFNVNSSQSMRLDKIYLFNSADADGILSTLGGASTYTPSGRSVPCSDCELANNMIDKADINALGRSAVESKAIRIIDFNYDYSLAKETANSFDINNSSVKLGKLTLNSVAFRGKGGASLLPLVDFEYGLGDTEVKSASGTLSNTNFQSSNTSLEIGDMLETTDNDPIYCGVIITKSQSASDCIYTLKNGSYAGTTAGRVLRTTKNPNYNKDAYDNWGMYKSDYVSSDNENLSRATTPTSNKSVDAWSLRKVTTSLGAELKINYEGDTYGRSVLNKDHALIINGFTKLRTTTGDYTFTVNFPPNQLATDYFNIGDKVDLILSKQFSHSGIYSYSILSSASNSSAPIITGLSGNAINIRVSPDFDSNITSNPSGQTSIINTGNLRQRGGDKFYGGGIRVKSVTVDNLSGTKNITNYDYQMPYSTMSSGVTSYEPILFDVDNIMTASGNDPDVARKTEARKNYRRELYKDANELLNISREIPTPGIMYEYVTTSTEVLNDIDNQIRNVPGKTELQFEVFRKNMIGRQDVSPRRSAPGAPNGGSYYTRNLALKKFVSNIGALKRSVTYSAQGNKLSEIINHYLDDGLEGLTFEAFMTAYEQRLAQFKKQGLVKERYSEIKSVWVSSAVFDILATMSAREEYPSILLGQTKKDYLTGTTSDSENLEFDFYSGVPTKQIQTDGYGNRFMKESVPAYKIYPNMGLKTTDNFNKNMLTQEAGNYLYKVDANNNKQGVISASTQLWSVVSRVLDLVGDPLIQNDVAINGNVWRKSASYNWMPDVKTTNGLTDMNSFSDFNWGNPIASSTNWKKTSEITLYDVFSKPLETKNINGQFSMSKLGYQNSKLILSGNFGRYDEFAFSGAEDLTPDNRQIAFSGNVTGGDAQLITNDLANTHTGSRSLLVGPGNYGFRYTIPINRFDPDRTYTAAVWVKPYGGGDISGAKLSYKVDDNIEVLSVGTPQKTAGGWYLLEITIPSMALSGINFSVGCKNTGTSSFYMDDFRFQPLNGTSLAYVYDTHTGELTYTLDNNNLYTKYEYDAMGRLVKISKEVLGKTSIVPVKDIEYNYAMPHVN